MGQGIEGGSPAGRNLAKIQETPFWMPTKWGWLSDRPCLDSRWQDRVSKVRVLRLYLRCQAHRKAGQRYNLWNLLMAFVSFG